MRTIAVIPCHNEAKHIAEVVRDTLPYVSNVIVVANLCTDKTEEVAALSGAYVRLCSQKGAGATTREGIKWAFYLGADVVVTLDGDGQHHPGEMPALLTPIVNEEADIVIGSRFMNGHTGYMPKYREFGIQVVNKCYNILAEKKLTDTLCCFRAFTRKALSLIPIEDAGFGFGTEMLIKARRERLRVIEVPVARVYHRDFRQNHTKFPVQHGLELVYATLKWRLKCEL